MTDRELTDEETLALKLTPGRLQFLAFFKHLCHKCGLDHENPVNNTEAVRILACELSASARFVTREGQVPTPNMEDYIR